MERIEEVQQPPLIFTIILTVMVIAASEFLTLITASSTAQANQVYWLIDRAAGVTAYELLSVSIVLGLSMTLKLWDKLGLRKWAKQLHQYITLLVLPFIGLHLFGLYMDSSVSFNLAGLFVPFAATYKSFLSALGTLSMYGTLLLIVSSYLRQRISVKAWRTIHMLSFPTFLAVTIHGLAIGTDSHTLLGYLIYAVPALLIGMFTAVRVMSRQPVQRGKVTIQAE